MDYTPTATVNELNEAFKESLERKGVMGKLRASLRSELFKCLQTSVQQIDSNKEAKDLAAFESRPPQTGVPHENGIIDQLFIEYLEFNRYSYTLSTFKSELSSDTPFGSGCDPGVCRGDLEKSLGITQRKDSCNQYTGSSKTNLPLIYEIVTKVDDASDRKPSCSTP